MKKVVVASAVEVHCKPLVVDAFIETKQQSVVADKVSKKHLKEIADTLGLAYSDQEIIFAKKVLQAYLKDRIV